MATRTVIDSDVLIGLMRNSEDSVVKVRALAETHSLFTTDVNAFELYYGAYKSSKTEENLATVKGLLNSLIVLSTDEDSMEIAGKIGAELSKKGSSIEIRDLLIASVSLVNGCSLLTNNEKHFSRVKGLTLVK